jgi:hypothetical protein
MKDISLLILSWKSHKTLINTLESYKNNGLLDFACEKIIFFQECSDADIEIAKQYNFDFVIGSTTNIGISEAISELVNHSTKKYFLLLENDWELVCNKIDTESRLSNGIELLDNYNVDVVRYRHRYKYGEPNYAFGYKGRELSGLFCILESSYWLDNPDINFSEYIKKLNIGNDYFYTASSKNANFTNNPTMYNRENYLKIMKLYTSSNTILEESHIHNWWNTQNYKVAQGEGLFFHNRLDR